MKIDKLLQMAGLVALMGAATACADDALVQGNEQQESAKGQPVSLQVSMPSGESRIAFNEGDSKMTLAWEEGDTLKVIGATDEITNFFLTEGAGTADGSFEGTPATAYANGETLHALYHNQLVNSQIDSDGNITLRLNEQDGTLNDDYLLLYGTTSYAEGQGMKAVQLRSLVSILKLTIPTDKTLTQVTLGRNQFRSKATLVVKNSPSNSNYHSFQAGDLVYCYSDDKIEENDLIKATGRFEPKDGVVTVYFYILPARRYWEDEDWLEDRCINFSFTAIDEDGKEYINAKEFNERTLEQGKMYRIQTGLFSFVDFENEATADGSKEKPYEIANAEQLYSLMMRCNMYYSDKHGCSYRSRHYKLTDDIHLDGSISWRAFDLDFGGFDGDGHTVYGPITNSFFFEVYGSTIQNLGLSLDISIDFVGYDNYGVLAYRTTETVIQNCINYTGFKSLSRVVGGLVGAMEYNSKMIACVNMGSISTTSNDVQMVGGLVGSLRFGSTIEGCYSTGHITVLDGNTVYIGGLAGTVNYDGYEMPEGYQASKMTGCWTNATFEYSNVSNAYRGDITGQGKTNVDYFKCYKIDSDKPSSGTINSLNAGLAEIGSLCGFDENGFPHIKTTSSGGAGGENFGNGGEF